MLPEHTSSNTKRVVNKLLKHNPRQLKDFKKIGLILIPLGSGAYRSVYRVKGSNVVIKIPISNQSSNLVHAREEIAAIKKINRCTKKYAKIIPMMPEIYYFEHESGIVAMKMYKKMGANYRYTVSKLVQIILELVYDGTHVWSMDVHSANVHLDENNNPVIIDLGYFTKKGRDYTW